MKSTTIIKSGALALFIAILLGAFGAHGLKSHLDEAHLHTYNTGVDYWIYHGLGLILLGVLKQQFPSAKIERSVRLQYLGILLFSVCCCLYAVTDVKAFAMIVPLGGLSFILSWGLLFLTSLSKD